MKNYQSSYTSGLDLLIYDQALTYLQREERGPSIDNTAPVAPGKKQKSALSRTPAKRSKAAKAA